MMGYTVSLALGSSWRIAGSNGLGSSPPKPQSPSGNIIVRAYFMLLFTPSGQPVKKNQPGHVALISLIRRQVEERLKIEVIVPIRHVVVHLEGFRGHDWFAKRACGVDDVLAKTLACDEAGKSIGCGWTLMALADKKSV